VGAPGPSEVVFDVLAFPINPADLSMCRGTYRLRPALPATPGAEGVGRVTAVGAGVTHVKPGDLVINLQRENWAQRRRVKGADVIAVPSGLDLRQAAMLRINPATAQLLLADVAPLEPGDWVIQNVANSAVGRLVIALARRRGIKTRTSCGASPSSPSSGRSARTPVSSTVPSSPPRSRRRPRARRSRSASTPSRDARPRAVGVRLRRRGRVQLRLDERRGSGDVTQRAELGRPDAGGLHPRPRAGPVLARPGSSALRRSRPAGARGHPLGTRREGLRDRDIKAALAHAQRAERGGKILVAPNGSVTAGGLS